jgi:DNA-binding CsgD family transcriptional regulator
MLRRCGDKSIRPGQRRDETLVKRPIRSTPYVHLHLQGDSKMRQRLHPAEQLAFADQGLRLLTPREREILDRVVVGETNKEIGKSLQISHRTVEVHRGRIHDKLGVSGLAELVRLVVTLEYRDLVRRQQFNGIGSRPSFKIN